MTLLDTHLSSRITFFQEGGLSDFLSLPRGKTAKRRLFLSVLEHCHVGSVPMCSAHPYFLQPRWCASHRKTSAPLLSRVAWSHSARLRRMSPLRRKWPSSTHRSRRRACSTPLWSGLCNVFRSSKDITGAASFPPKAFWPCSCGLPEEPSHSACKASAASASKEIRAWAAAVPPDGETLPLPEASRPRLSSSAGLLVN